MNRISKYPAVKVFIALVLVLIDFAPLTFVALLLRSQETGSPNLYLLLTVAAVIWTLCFSLLISFLIPRFLSKRD